LEVRAHGSFQYGFRRHHRKVLRIFDHLIALFSTFGGRMNLL